MNWLKTCLLSYVLIGAATCLAAPALAQDCANSFFPMVIGSTYVYESTLGTYQRRVDSSDRVAWSIRFPGHVAEGSTQVECLEGGVRYTDGYDSRASFPRLAAAARDDLRYDRGVAVPRASAWRIGSTWERGGLFTSDGTGQAGGQNFRMQTEAQITDLYTIRERAHMNLRFGSFPRAFRVERSQRIMGTTTTTVLGNSITTPLRSPVQDPSVQWYVRGVGLVVMENQGGRWELRSLPCEHRPLDPAARDRAALVMTRGIEEMIARLTDTRIRDAETVSLQSVRAALELSLERFTANQVERMLRSGVRIWPASYPHLLGYGLNPTTIRDMLRGDILAAYHGPIRVLFYRADRQETETVLHEVAHAWDDVRNDSMDEAVRPDDLLRNDRVAFNHLIGQLVRRFNNHTTEYSGTMPEWGEALNEFRAVPRSMRHSFRGQVGAADAANLTQEFFVSSYLTFVNGPESDCQALLTESPLAVDLLLQDYYQCQMPPPNQACRGLLGYVGG